MMQIEALLERLDAPLYQKLKSAVELGKWADGTPLSKTQREAALQAVIAYQSKHLNQTQHLSVGADGELVTLSKKQLKTQYKPLKEEQIARFNQDDF